MLSLLVAFFCILRSLFLAAFSHPVCSYGKIKSIKLVHDKQVRFRSPLQLFRFHTAHKPSPPSQGKPRGYAFIEFEEERSVKEAFDRFACAPKPFTPIVCFKPVFTRADGRKIDGRRVLVDVERGRTVKGWKPRSVFLSSHEPLVRINI